MSSKRNGKEDPSKLEVRTTLSFHVWREQSNI